MFKDGAGTAYNQPYIGKGEIVIERRCAFQAMGFGAPMPAVVDCRGLIVPELAFARAFGWQSGKGSCDVVL